MSSSSSADQRPPAAPPARFDPAMLLRAFTLIELLVVVAIIGLLVAILVPALQGARLRSRLLLCVTNARSQAAVMLAYTTDFVGALPPRLVWYEHEDSGIEVHLFNRILAGYNKEEFRRRDDGLLSPTGAWRCPDVPADDAGRWTHTGVIHYSPNRWLFNLVYYLTDETDITAEAPPGWTDRFARPEWRRLERVAHPSDVLTLMDSVYYYVAAHNHTHCRETFAYGREIIHDSIDPAYAANEGSHEALHRRPAAMLDGHAEALPSTREYWLDLPAKFRPLTRGGSTYDFFQQEAKRLMWFLDPHELVTP